MKFIDKLLNMLRFDDEITKHGITGELEDIVPYVPEQHLRPYGEDIELVEWCGYGREEDWRNCSMCVVRKKVQ